MIILGDISGIQNYVFDVAEEGGGQAQRLRARSFFVQLLAETAALRVLRALNWPLTSVRLSGAGKFLLEGDSFAAVESSLVCEQHEINEWLLGQTRGELRLAIAWADSGSDIVSYQEAQQRLQRSKARPWAPQTACWDSTRLILAPLGTPCSLCGHAPATESETERDTGEMRQVCRMCAESREIGRRLPCGRWLIIRDRVETTRFELLGFGVEIASSDHVTAGPGIVAVANLRDPEERPSWCPPERFLKRRLMAHVPTDDEGTPIWFTDLAKRSQGDDLLAVLKADADSLGVCFEHLLNSKGLDAVRSLSDRLDAFFAGRLRQELANHAGPWQSIYTIFAGGDDLIMVGPWNIMVDFASTMRKWFAEEFRDHTLTLSAGLELIKPKRPIKPAVKRAEVLLNEAKDSGKDRLAAFGQVWLWKDHEAVISAAKRLVEWVNAGDIQRGWLHTLLELALARHGDKPEPLATARLAYHVDRNWKKGTPARQWADRLVCDFDEPNKTQVRYLPAIVRYALTATRTRDEED